MLLDYDEAPVTNVPCSKKDITEGNITPEQLELIFCCLSEKQQDAFLESLKEILNEEDWKALVIHLKSYDLAMMGDFRAKSKVIKTNMAVAVYEDLKD